MDAERLSLSAHAVKEAVVSWNEQADIFEFPQGTTGISRVQFAMHGSHQSIRLTIDQPASLTEPTLRDFIAEYSTSEPVEMSIIASEKGRPIQCQVAIGRERHRVDVTSEIVESTIRSVSALTYHGKHRLKDIERVEHRSLLPSIDISTHFGYLRQRLEDVFRRKQNPLLTRPSTPASILAKMSKEALATLNERTTRYLIPVERGLFRLHASGAVAFVERLSRATGLSRVWVGKYPHFKKDYFYSDTGHPWESTFRYATHSITDNEDITKTMVDDLDDSILLFPPKGRQKKETWFSAGVALVLSEQHVIGVYKHYSSRDVGAPHPTWVRTVLLMEEKTDTDRLGRKKPALRVSIATIFERDNLTGLEDMEENAPEIEIFTHTLQTNWIHQVQPLLPNRTILASASVPIPSVEKVLWANQAKRDELLAKVNQQQIALELEEAMNEVVRTAISDVESNLEEAEALAQLLIALPSRAQ